MWEIMALFLVGLAAGLLLVLLFVMALFKFFDTVA